MLRDIELLGDPHLGRAFRNNVPLHRRGEREAMIWQRFEQAIRSTEAATHVCLGDLFDAPLVSFDTIWQTAKACWAAPETTRFIVLQGNHDRDGVTVNVVGSMVPLAHGEDPGADLYVTASLEEVLADPGAYREKCLRIVLQPGESLEVPIDCLQLVVQRAEEQADAPSVEFASFDLMQLFERAFEEEMVAGPIRERILARYQAESVRS